MLIAKPVFRPIHAVKYSNCWFGRARNRLGYLISDRFTRPVTTVVDRYRRQWDLKPYIADDSFSPFAQISQQPPLFDYPRRRLPPQFHYAGPLRGASSVASPFPWEKLDGRPLVYASLGTLQNSRFPVFRCFAEACQKSGRSTCHHPRRRAQPLGSGCASPGADSCELCAPAGAFVTRGINSFSRGTQHRSRFAESSANCRGSHNL